LNSRFVYPPNESIGVKKLEGATAWLLEKGAAREKGAD